MRAYKSCPACDQYISFVLHFIRFRSIVRTGFFIGSAIRKISSRLIHPVLYAISSRQAIFNPCLFSITSTNVDASDRDSWVPVSSQAYTIIINKILANDKSLSQPIGTGLFGIMEIYAIFASVTQQSFKTG